MSNGRSTSDLLKFIDYLGEKGLMPAATAASRKASAKKMLAILSEDESRDVTLVDMNEVALRFHTLKGQQYTPGSIQTYKSRVVSAIDDFRSYLASPLSFRSSSKPRHRNRGVKRTSDEVGINSHPANNNSVNASNRPNNAPSPAGANILPIALRSDLTIQIAGLPLDLTLTEAKKIANIIVAHALDG